MHITMVIWSERPSSTSMVILQLDPRPLRPGLLEKTAMQTNKMLISIRFSIRISE